MILLFSDCDLLPDIRNGDIRLTGTSYNDTATYNCSTGYYISSGNTTRTCMEGLWTGSRPVCTIYGLYIRVQI